MIKSDQFFRKYEKLSNDFVKNNYPMCSITILCDCSNEGNASNIVIGIVHFYHRFTSFWWNIWGPLTEPIIQKPLTMYCLS